ncbi:low molecular weight protein-tyrosine-phosphatase [Marinibacterium profundimaris]|uniref:protein-tyrosine-phosphatase n=1 Tax=Marinibacterium profundimaris TaxID=1679460 RepID=A0A225NI81_9RHOB|nr:low molecular weight protein-tyrosine-phosphatase [Marinibacterium profundimaris]OWU70444.1 phosphotyrosine protein phosphatase [Marinibacterium profundimaris]
MRILFVCLGNICRSPAAEAVARMRLPGHDCDSAGTSGWHEGEPPYPPMIRAAAARGIPMTGLYARKAIADDFNRFDLILAMDGRTLDAMEDLRPSGNRTDLRRLADFIDGEVSDVPDPYYSRDFDGALDLIEVGIAGLDRWLERQAG